ncbi:very-long-chain (3R)-3-hydroxyacyl-CoA dehydratase 3-like [Ostrea edulis]|uniref:very-long-chain (3R)-3-hydroxyacyl-CoA dehydratase 3-like n=1 Tax=Ostrea edulis TaxID=37623 RepID=UPI0024AFD23F|nr:very-long-chain (3R)-3-hydroxyacyl-CoA dehydratase 3-like [Ostrea edulis]
MAAGAETLTPFVYWGQKTDHVSLKIDLKDVVNPKVDLTEDGLKFEADGTGIRGHNLYQLDIDFYHPVDPDKSRYRVLDRCVDFYIQKTGSGEVWPRLTNQKIKYPWLKIDFDKVAYEDESESEAEEQKSAEDVMKQLEKELQLDSADAPDLPDLKTVYLFVYNLFQFVGFTFISFTLLVNFFKNKEKAMSSGFNLVGNPFMVCQTAAIMEILHPVLGLVKSSAITPLLQVLGRNFILFVVILHEENTQTAPLVFFLLLTWSSIEVFRYPFYMLAVLNKKIYAVTWMRYTLWIPLYPLGLFLEGKQLCKSGWKMKHEKK